MTERHRRERVRQLAPPSRHMRSLLREAISSVYQLRLDCEYGTIAGPGGLRQVRRALALCRRATARDCMPDWFAPLIGAVPQTIGDTAALVDRVLMPLRTLDAAWRQRLSAAGIDPKWPGGDA